MRDEAGIWSMSKLIYVDTVDLIMNKKMKKKETMTQPRKIVSVTHCEEH